MDEKKNNSGGNVNPNGMKWLAKFAGKRKGLYFTSVFSALLGVAASLIPYFVIAQVISELIGGNKDQSFYVQKGLLIAGCFILRYVFHAISTTISHYSTFKVLADIRKTLLSKLASLPLGTVQEQSSGSYKNTICERVDSIETTLAHIVPEFTSNI